MGFIVSHYRNPYQTASIIMESNKVSFFVAQVVRRFFLLNGIHKTIASLISAFTKVKKIKQMCWFVFVGDVFKDSTKFNPHCSPTFGECFSFFQGPNKQIQECR